MKTWCKVLCSIYCFKRGSSSLSRPLKSKRNPILITFSNIVLKPLLYMEFYKLVFYSKSLERDDATTHILTDI